MKRFARLAVAAAAVAVLSAPLALPQAAGATGSSLPSPAAFWKLDEASGTTAVDSSGNGYNGTYSGAYTLQAGKTPAGGQSVDFTGGEVTTPYVQTSVTSYSIGAWIKTTESSSSQSFAIVSDRGSGSGDSLTLSLGGPGEDKGGICFGADTNGAYVGACTQAVLDNGNWYDITGVYSGATGSVVPSQFSIYVNGAPVATNSITIGSFVAPLSGLGGTLVAGTETWSNYTGRLADVALYTTALTSSQVASQYVQSTQDVQTTWVKRYPATRPQARYGASMTYDPATSQVVMFGGMGATGPLASTWAWDGADWKKLSPATSPPARYGASMAYAYGTGQLVLFGGMGPSGPLDGTWDWTGSNWTELHPAASPPARAYAPMSFAGQLIMAGGAGATGNPLPGTWAWNGSTWWQASSSPPARYGASIARYQSTGKIVLFGGHSADGCPTGCLSGTREWAVVGGQLTWASQSPTTSPPARYGASMAWYGGPGTQRLVLFGGVGASGYLGDTWAWDGSDWTKLDPAKSPSPRYEAASAYDQASQQLVLFGGTGTAGISASTWTWEVPKWYPA